MKRFLSLVVAAVAMFTMNAQTYVAPKFTDNTYVTLRYGVTGLMKPSSLSSFNYVGGTCGDKSNGFAHSLAQQTELQFGKWVTPRFAVALDGVVSWDTFSSLHKMSDYTVPFITVSALAKYRFVDTNKFAFTTVTGPGWVHGFVKNSTGKNDKNDLMAKFQLEFTYKLTDRLDVDVVPELNYNLTRNGANKQPYFDSHDAWYGLNVGITYRLGKQFTECPYRYTHSAVDALNAEINELRARQPQVVEKIVEKVIIKEVSAKNDIKEANVLFDFDSAQLSNEAKAMLDNITGEVEVIGSASPEGTKTHNAQLAAKRAEAVANYLKARNVKVKNVTADLNIGSRAATVK